jgi:hypothetical protein
MILRALECGFAMITLLLKQFLLCGSPVKRRPSGNNQILIEWPEGIQVTLRVGRLRVIPVLLVRSSGCARSSILCRQTVQPACVLPGETQVNWEKGMTVLLTGGSGNLGQTLVPRLLGQGDTPVILDVRLRGI